MTFKERFVQAITAIVGTVPPPTYVANWLNDQETEDGAWELLDWVAENLPNELQWAQAIDVLDAAHVIAKTPEEGVDHD